MLFTVFGSPISHSLSPVIHHAFSDQFALNLTYTRTLASLSDFAEKLTLFKKNPEAIGANITAPLKQLAFSLCNQLTPRAQLAESVNTLYWDEDKLVGDNTDGVGFEKAIYTHGKQTFEDQHILLLGAGGAALGIVPIILTHSPKSLYIFNRTEERATLLCEKYNQRQNQVNIKVLSESNVLAFDWVINAADQLDLLENCMFKKITLAGAKFFDLSYAQIGLSNFLEKAKSFTPTWMDDGLAMLIEQGAESFYVWHQRKPETSEVLMKIRSEPTTSS